MRSYSSRMRDRGEYRRNKEAIKARRPDVCALCNGKEGPLLYEEDIDGSRWYLHPLAFTVDHIIPLIEGGTNALSNLRPAHRRCNSARNRRLSTEQLPRNVRDFGMAAVSPYGKGRPVAPRSF